MCQLFNSGNILIKDQEPGTPGSFRSHHNWQNLIHEVFFLHELRQKREMWSLASAGHSNIFYSFLKFLLCCTHQLISFPLFTFSYSNIQVHCWTMCVNIMCIIYQFMKTMWKKCYKPLSNNAALSISESYVFFYFYIIFIFILYNFKVTFNNVCHEMFFGCINCQVHDSPFSIWGQLGERNSCLFSLIAVTSCMKICWETYLAVPECN